MQIESGFVPISREAESWIRFAEADLVQASREWVELAVKRSGATLDLATPLSIDLSIEVTKLMGWGVGFSDLIPNGTEARVFWKDNRSQHTISSLKLRDGEDSIAVAVAVYDAFIKTEGLAHAKSSEST